MNTSEYIPVSIDELSAGMRVDFSIFHEYHGEYVLLCKDTLLTEDMISRFKRITAPGYMIYIPNENYRIMTGNISLAPPVARGRAEVFDGYNEVKRETAKLFQSAAEEDRISQENAQTVARDVEVKIATVDVSDIIQSINSVRAVDEYLYTHSVNVALLNGLMGKWLGYDQSSLDILVKIGLLHDVGKLKIPSEILNKPGKLTKAEFDVIKGHPIYSYKILMQSGVTDRRILEGVIQHHEKVNGFGYPRGLHLEQIDELARITSISDVYDAMVAKRVYKEAHSPFEILAWFAQGCYSDLDIHFVQIFLDCMIDEFKGKTAVLSDGRQAEVVFIPSSNLAYPIVQVDGETIHTGPELHCVSIVQGFSA